MLRDDGRQSRLLDDLTAVIEDLLDSHCVAVEIVVERSGLSGGWLRADGSLSWGLCNQRRQSAQVLARH